MAAAATALGLGLPQHSMMRSGLAGQRMTGQTPLDLPFGSGPTNPLAGIAGLNTGLRSAHGGNNPMQLDALRGSSQHQSVMLQPGQLLQVRQARAQQQATAVAEIQ